MTSSVNVIPMKYLLLPLLVLPALLMSLLPSTDPAPAAAAEEASVEMAAKQMADHVNYAVLELFTSQGCSSCPPADALLQELKEANENVIALSFHVDYWNYLGWSDPFSSPYFSARQTDYTDALQARTFTPQLVINGRTELIGSRRSEVKEAVKTALAQKHTVFPSLSTKTSGNKIIVGFALDNVPANHRVTALLVQPEATSSVSRGENRGRELHHINVVRAMAHTKAVSSGEITLALPEGLTAGETEVVLLVQDEEGQGIIGVARAQK
jgi:hypothetical protein